MDNSEKATWINTKITIISIIVGIILTAFSLGYTIEWYSLSFFSIALLLILYLNPTLHVKSAKEPTHHFISQLGHDKNIGLLPHDKRLEQIKWDKNPYVCGSALAGNSAVFYGRERELEGCLQQLQRDKPGNVNIIGERRIGKSSLLNQIYQGLAQECNLITVKTSAQDWNFSQQSEFFIYLHQALCRALKIKCEKIDSYQEFSDFIALYAKKNYRFVLLIDEFDKLAEKELFDDNFFTQLRVLGDSADYHFGYVIASYFPLSDLCQPDKIAESKFFNIFGVSYTLGLLSEQEAKQLIQEPIQLSLDKSFESYKDIFNDTGYHPAFIQMVANLYWNALYGGHKVNAADIHGLLRPYYKYLWEHKTPNQQALLRAIAQGQTVEENYELENLRSRGVVTTDNQLFSDYFKQFILSS